MQKTDRAVLMLHGFPGNANVKNLDITYLLHQQLNAHIYLMHYDGLGESRGKFKFTTALQNAVAVADLIPRLGHRLSTVIGHSWGGLVGMYLAATVGSHFEDLILLSPLSDLDESDPLFPWLAKGVRNDCPGIYDHLSDEDVLADLRLLAQKATPRDLVTQFPERINTTVIQASRDDVTPAAKIKALLKFFSSPVTYKELDMDHSFTQNRSILAANIASSLPPNLHITLRSLI